MTEEFKPADFVPTVTPWNPPDRLCADPRSPYYNAEWLALCVVFLNGNVVKSRFLYEYSISERWVTLLRREGDKEDGTPLYDPSQPWARKVFWTVKKSGRVEVMNVNTLNSAQGNA